MSNNEPVFVMLRLREQEKRLTVYFGLFARNFSSIAVNERCRISDVGLDFLFCRRFSRAFR